MSKKQDAIREIVEHDPFFVSSARPGGGIELTVTSDAQSIAREVKRRLERSLTAAIGIDYATVDKENRLYIADEASKLVAAMTAVGLVLIPRELVGASQAVPHEPV